jgi:hypothetical protein
LSLPSRFCLKSMASRLNLHGFFSNLAGTLSLPSLGAQGSQWCLHCNTSHLFTAVQASEQIHICQEVRYHWAVAWTNLIHAAQCKVTISSIEFHGWMDAHSTANSRHHPQLLGSGLTQNNKYWGESCW